MAKKRSPHLVDVHVGARIRMQRLVLGMSQSQLGEALGITFQQIQKYEKGSNRVSASRLQQIADALKMPVVFFFEGAPSARQHFKVESGGPSAASIIEFLTSTDGLTLARVFSQIKDRKVRRKIVDLVEQLSE